MQGSLGPWYGMWKVTIKPCSKYSQSALLSYRANQPLSIVRLTRLGPFASGKLGAPSPLLSREFPWFIFGAKLRLHDVHHRWSIRACIDNHSCCKCLERSIPSRAAKVEMVAPQWCRNNQLLVFSRLHAHFWDQSPWLRWAAAIIYRQSWGCTWSQDREGLVAALIWNSPPYRCQKAPIKWEKLLYIISTYWKTAILLHRLCVAITLTYIKKPSSQMAKVLSNFLLLRISFSLSSSWSLSFFSNSL